MKNLNNLLTVLLENNIDFVLIGGYAGALYGSSLVTKDIDICMDLSPENIAKLRSILKNHHPVHRMTPKKLSFLVHPENLQDVKNLYLSSDLGPLDIISDVIGVGDFKKVKANAVAIQLFGHVCNVISMEDLILTKKSMDRDKDKLAVKELESIIKKKK